MPDATALEEYYKTLTDQQLLNLKREGGFTVEAERVLGNELARRKLGPHDVTQYAAVIKRDKLREEVTERGGGYRELGFQLFGGRYVNEADRHAKIQVRTKWFTISGIPLIPIASYRFNCKSSAGKRSVIERVSLDWPQVFQTWAKTAVTLIGAVLLIIGICWFFARARH